MTDRDVLEHARLGAQHVLDEVTRELALLNGRPLGRGPDHKPRRHLSAAARARISRAQKKRWREYHAGRHAKSAFGKARRAA